MYHLLYNSMQFCVGGGEGGRWYLKTKQTKHILFARSFLLDKRETIPIVWYKGGNHTILIFGELWTWRISCGVQAFIFIFYFINKNLTGNRGWGLVLVRNREISEREWNNFRFIQSIDWERSSGTWLDIKLLVVIFLFFCFSEWTGGGKGRALSVCQHKCLWSGYVWVCVCACVCVCKWVYVGMGTETCEHVCVRLHIHPNLHTYSLHVSVCVCACACVRVCRWLWGCLCFSVSVSLCFVWLSMCSNVLLCYWLLCEYLRIPCFSLIKWQSNQSCQTCTINSILLLKYIITSWLKHQAEFDIVV